MTALALFVAGGCESFREPFRTRPRDPMPLPNASASERASAEASIFNRPLQRLFMEFSVHRISAPSGAFTRDASLWKVVSGPLPSAGKSLDLAANGIRAAIGRESDRPALKAFLEQLPDPRATEAQALPDPSKVIEIDIGPCDPRQTVFYYDHAGRVHGLDFLNGKSRFRIAYELRYSNLQESWLEVVAEIEEPPGPPKWVIHSDGRAEQVDEIRRHPFTELAFSARIPPGGFLLLGPTVAAHERPLLGRPLFIEAAQEPGQSARESVYVVSPVIRTVERPTATRPAAGQSDPSGE